MENHISLNILPLEILTEHIIPIYPKDWLGVSKEFHDRVIPILFTDPRIKRSLYEFEFAMIELGHLKTITILMQDWCFIDDYHYEAAIKHNQLEILKIFISREIRGKLLDEENPFATVMNIIITYDAADILEYLYSEFQFTTEAKKQAMIQIMSHPKFGSLLHRIIQESDIESSWIEDVVRKIAFYGHNSTIEWILRSDRFNFAEVYGLLNTVASSCNLENLKLLLEHPQMHFTRRDMRETLGTLAKAGNRDGFTHLYTRYNFSTKDITGLLSYACSSSNVDLVAMLLNDSRIDPAELNNLPIRYAAEYGHATVVELLLNDSRVDPRVNTDELLSAAIRRNRLQNLQVLLQSSKINYEETKYYNLAKFAAYLGRPEILKYLIDTMKVDPSWEECELLFTAINQDNKNIVRLLLLDPRVDPSINDNQALDTAEAHQRNKIARILLQDERVKALYEANNNLNK